jgi:hypothetical protein
MRRAFACSVLALLVVPSAASAQTLDYAAPTASISRGAPLTFAVRTTAPAGSVVVRVSGSDDVGADGLLTGPTGTWRDEIASPEVDGLQVWRVPDASLLRSRPGHYFWQAYVSGEAANGVEEPIGPVQELVVTVPASDRGSGKLYPRYGKRGRTAFYLSTEDFPATVDGARFRTLVKNAAKRWGLQARRWTSAKAGVEDGYNVAGFSTRMKKGILGVQTDHMLADGRIVERDLELNANVSWGAGPGYPALDEFDLESVLIHELGHMAGTKRHRASCSNSPMVEALGAGEWWRGPRDKWFGDCRPVAGAASTGRLVHRLVRVD